jgi:hypothetical protein
MLTDPTDQFIVILFIICAVGILATRIGGSR